MAIVRAILSSGTEYHTRTDIFTTPLPRERFNFLIDKIGMRSMSPETLKRLAEETEYVHRLVTLYHETNKCANSSLELQAHPTKNYTSVSSVISTAKSNDESLNDKFIMSTQEYMQKVVEDVGEDADFNSGAWAMNSLIGLRFLNFFNAPRIIRKQRIAAYKGYSGGGVVQIEMNMTSIYTSLEERGVSKLQGLIKTCVKSRV
ncbi:hypothetical protein Tco_0016427 [Tanacetum coccineum]